MRHPNVVKGRATYEAVGQALGLEYGAIDHRV